MQPIIPWHEPAWQYFINRRNIGKLPHAILIKGIDGVGKLAFAKNLAALLFCQGQPHDVVDEAVNSASIKPTINETINIACGQCEGCILLQADNHPDFLLLQPEEEDKAIKVDQVREMIADLNNTPHQGGYKVVIIEKAELLNIAAANSLLKTLEEPAAHTIIILISAHPLMLSATIRSRCQTLTIRSPKYFVADRWLRQQMPDLENVDLLLALAENAPFRALNIAQSGMLIKRQEFFQRLVDLQQEKISSMQMVSRCLDWKLNDLLIMLVYIVDDLIRIKLTTMRHIVNQDQIKWLTSFAAKVNINKLLSYKDHLYKLRRYYFDKINLNQQMIIENLIIKWLHINLDSSVD